MSHSPGFERWDAGREADLHAAARCLARGGAVLVPTESSYALAAAASSEEGVARVRAAKGRAEAGRPLLLLAASRSQVEGLAALGGASKRLAAAWPAPITLLLEPKDAALAARLGGPDLAVRVPAHDAARRLAEIAGAFTGTSANAAGEPPLLDPAQARGSATRLGADGILDAGVLPGGAPSTLVDARIGAPRVLRQGAFAAWRLADATGGPPVLGLTGPNSAGKGEAAAYLSGRHGYRLHSLSDVVRDEASRRGLEPVRGVLIALGNELRAAGGAGVLARMVLDRLAPPEQGPHLVDSIRNPEEVAVLRTLPGFLLLSVDAPLEERYRRSLQRARPGDPATLEEFRAREQQENSNDPKAQQLAATAALADRRVSNEGTLDDLHAGLDALVLGSARP